MHVFFALFGARKKAGTLAGWFQKGWAVIDPPTTRLGSPFANAPCTGRLSLQVHAGAIEFEHLADVDALQ